MLGAGALLGAVLGGAGVIGIALGFAMRDTIENYVASLMLSLRQPFRANDHVVIDDLDVGEVRVLSVVGNDIVHVLAVRAGKHPEWPVVRGRVRHREPGAYLGSPVEGEVEDVLVPGLPERAGQLEDELGEETIELRPDQALHAAQEPCIQRELVKHGLGAMYAENFGGAVFGGFPVCEGLFGDHVGIADGATAVRNAGHFDDSGFHRLEDLGSGESPQDHEAFRLPRVPLCRSQAIHADCTIPALPARVKR